MDEKTFGFPTIHLNGTPAKSLQDEYRAAWDAINAAEKAVAAITTHMRDYYVQQDGAARFSIARAAQRARLTKLAEMKIELESLWSHVFEQACEREPKKGMHE